MDGMFGGEIKRIQWNNRLKTSILCLSFILGIFIFTSLWILLFMIPVVYFEGVHEVVNKITGDGMLFYGGRILKIYVKMFFLIWGIFSYFIYIDLKNVGLLFGAQRLDLPHNDPFYQVLENFCISRGLSVPDLYIGGDNAVIPPHLVTGAVVQDYRKTSSLVITPAVYNLEKPQLEAFLAQAVQRIYTNDTMFLTMFCFLGFFPRHIMRHANIIFKTLSKPFLTLVDVMLGPVRKVVLNMRFASLDVGALELTKEKEPMQLLMTKLATLEDLSHYIRDPYLSLFIVAGNDEYRDVLLKRA